VFDVQELRQLASDEGLNLTGDLSHAQADALAAKWAPEVRFHPRELFHSQTLRAYLDATESAPWGPDEWLPVLENGGVVLNEPPRIYCKAGSYEDCGSDFESSDIGVESEYRALQWERLVDYIPPDPKQLPQKVIIDPSYSIAKDKFGSAQQSPSGAQLPRDPAGVGVTSGLRFLLEGVELSLKAQRAGLDDALLGDFGFDVLYRAMLLELIDAHKRGDAAREAQLLDKLISEDVLTKTMWEAITEYAFLEYYFTYPYNDLQRYAGLAAPYDHEGDVESCCLAFRRSDLTVAGHQTAEPVYAISTRHGASAGLDQIRMLDPNDLDPPNQPVVVWVAGGSHATVLTGAGDYSTHAVWNGFSNAMGKGGGAVCAALGPLCVLGALLAAILDHFISPDDEARDDGVHSHPALGGSAAPDESGLTVANVPLSAGANLYQEPASLPPGTDVTLGERAFPGQWGGKASFADKPRRFLGRLTLHLGFQTPGGP